MRNLKLTYFDLRGRAEISRIVLAQAQVKYEDNRIKPEQWPQLKPDTPFGHLPVLEVTSDDGTKIELAQSMAIARYLANETGLGGKTSLERARIDMILDAVESELGKFASSMREPDAERKKAIVDKAVNEDFPNFVQQLQNLMEKNGNHEFIVGQELTVADIAVASLIDGLKNGSGAPKIEDLETKFEKMTQFSKNILELPKIKEWIEKRPDNPY